jgi:hypothetical protein
LFQNAVVVRLVPWPLLVVGLVMFLQRARHGLWFVGFSDESAALLGGRVIDAGGVLYRDFVDRQGPVLYMLTSAYGALAGWAHPNFARLILVAFWALAALAIGWSPALPNRASRIWATGLFLGLTAPVWLIQGLYLVNYYAIAGALAVIPLALFAVPTWLGRPIAPCAALMGGISAALLGFSCYSFMPTVVLFAVAGLWVGYRHGRLRPAQWFLSGIHAGSVFMLLWLLVFGNFAGYLAFHIAFDLTAYTRFIWVGRDAFEHGLILSSAPANLVQTLAVVICAVGGALALGLSACMGSRLLVDGPLACLLGLVGVLLLNGRGNTNFQDGTFVLGAIGMFSLMLPCTIGYLMPAPHPRQLVFVTLALMGLVTTVELTARHAVTTPAAMTRVEIVQQPPHLIVQRADTPIPDRIRAVVHPGETFLALVYQPDLYWAADRLPMPGFYEYLPWDAAYAPNPWFGRQHDLCAALQTDPPPLIAFDNWKVWDRYAPADYMPCVLRIMAERYRQLPDLPTLYVRMDRSGGG